MLANSPHRAARVVGISAALACAFVFSAQPARAQSCGVPSAYMGGGPFQAWRAIQSGGTLTIYRLGDLRSPVTGECSGNCRNASEERSVSVLSLAQASKYLSPAGIAWAAEQGFTRIELVTCNDENDRDRERSLRPVSSPPPDDPQEPEVDDEDEDEGYEEPQ